MNKSNQHKCEICKRVIADKTNSHIIPSFIICQAASADGTGKRNHELVFSIGEIVHAYIGNEVSQKEVERNFDDLSEERIEKELKNNTHSRDYVFCSSCEKSLGDYLESPYALNSRKDKDVAYYFWMSVVWRINHFGLFTNCMPKFILAELRKSLDEYLQARKSGGVFAIIKQRYPFSYCVLTCRGYSKDGKGCFYQEYDKSNRICSLVLGDYIACFNFKQTLLPDSYNFLGIEDILKQAPLNDGESIEEMKNVSEEVFVNAYKKIKEKAMPIYLNNEVNMIFRLWNELEKRHYSMPSPAPSDFFIQRCVENIHGENKKIGEKHTYRNFAVSFGKAMSEVYGIYVSDE